MKDHVSVPVREINGEKWGALSFMGDTHLICAESVKLKEQRYSLADQHRVALYAFRKNVHWKIPAGVDIDISDVKPVKAPRRKPRNAKQR